MGTVTRTGAAVFLPAAVDVAVAVAVLEGRKDCDREGKTGDRGSLPLPSSSEKECKMRSLALLLIFLLKFRSAAAATTVAFLFAVEISSARISSHRAP